MPTVIAPPRFTAFGREIKPLRIGAPRASANQGSYDGIISSRFFPLLSREALITRMVANQPISAIKMAPPTAGEIIGVLL